MKFKTELKKHHACFLKNREKYFEVISGDYRGSIFKVSNISLSYYSVATFDFYNRKILRFEYSQINFLSGNEYIPITKFDKKKYNHTGDYINQTIDINDIVAFTSSIYNKRNALRIGKVLSISNKHSVKLQTIPNVPNEKSIIIDLVWRNNIIKLSKDQIHIFMKEILSS